MLLKSLHVNFTFHCSLTCCDFIYVIFKSYFTKLVYTFPPSRVKELVWVVLTCKGRINGKDLAPRYENRR